ncbi:MAG TPA: helix-turn-helix domain-containing protein, partial [Pilimelia sp.]|nr:helix-turn-helix domain-containing protein [Pilimelia sp.]
PSADHGGHGPTGPGGGATAAPLGRRLQRLRNARGLTQRELAAPRYTAAYVSSVEAGRRVPSGDALAHFASRLGVTFQELATGRSPQETVRLDLDLVEADALAAHDPAGAAERYRRLAQEARALAEPARLARCHLGLGWAALRQLAPGRAIRQFEEAERLLVDASPPERAEAVAGRAAGLRITGDLRYAVYLLISVRDDLHRTGYPDPGALLTLHAHLAICGLELDDEELAGEAAATALALGGQDDPAGVAQMHLVVARTLLAAERAGEAGVALAHAREAVRRAGLRLELAWCHRARGRAQAAAGDVAGAARDLSVAYQIFTSGGQREQTLDVGVELAEIYRRLGRPDLADPLLSAALADPDQPARTAAARRELGLLAAARGDAAAAEAELRAAVAGFRRTGPRRELARAVGALGDLLSGQGRLAEAAAVLRDGLAGVEELANRG